MVFEATHLHRLHTLIATNTESRGLDKLPPSQDLEQAALDLWEAKRVLLLTGFVIAAHKIGETDGPPGTLGLALALDRLSKATCIVSDKYSLEALQQAIPLLPWQHTPRVICLEQGSEELISYNLLSQFNPDHIVAIERPGQNAAGRYHSMSGADFSHLVPDSDLLLHLARQQGIAITAIGDGGNEVGMGKIRDFVEQHVPYGETIGAAFAADHLIVAGISNWGAAALAALLSLSAKRQLMPDVAQEREVIEALCEAGLVDGATRSRSLSVDGMPLDDYLKVYEAIYSVSLSQA